MKTIRDVTRAKAGMKAKAYATGGAVNGKLSVDGNEAPMTNRRLARTATEGGTVDGGRARSRPDRSARKAGKGKANVNVIIAPPREREAPPTIPPPAMPRAAAPMPPPAPMPPAASPPGAGMPPPVVPGASPLLRKSGGRVMAKGGKVKC